MDLTRANDFEIVCVNCVLFGDSFVFNKSVSFTSLFDSI